MLQNRRSTSIIDQHGYFTQYSILITANSPVFDLLGHGQESLLDICRALGGSLEEWNVELVGEFLCEEWKCKIEVQEGRGQVTVT